MGKRQLPPEEPAEIHEVGLRDALEERYLAYALSTIMHRALPDARDGLKPVHRRILYGMRLLRLDPGTPFKKSAKIVGDVMGSFHPHGDQSIYDALVRLAQDFSSRYPLVDGQGNFGNIDGDNPAAYRYTEARMTEVARLVPHPREMEPRGRRAGHLGRGHHRNSVAGAEIAADRKDRRTAQREEAAAGRRRPRRIRRGHPRRHRAEVPRGRSGTADGIAVPPDRAGKPDSAEP